MTVLTLQAPGLVDLAISRASGYIIRSVERKQAASRPVVEDAPDMDGTIDTTALAGAGSLTIGVRLVPGADSFDAREQRLRAFARPRLRPVLRIDLQDGSPVRVATLSRGVVDTQTRRPTHQDIVAQWVIPSGVLEAAELSTVEVFPASTAPSPGMTFDAAFDLSFGGGSGVIGATTIEPGGTADVWPIIRVYGPCVDPAIEHVERGQQIAFAGLTVAAGDFVEIDTRQRTIRYNANAADPRYSSVDWAVSSWWPLSPEEQSIVFDPAGSSAPAMAEFAWRTAYI